MKLVQKRPRILSSPYGQRLTVLHDFIEKDNIIKPIIRGASSTFIIRVPGVGLRQLILFINQKPRDQLFVIRASCCVYGFSAILYRFRHKPIHFWMRERERAENYAIAVVQTASQKSTMNFLIHESNETKHKKTKEKKMRRYLENLPTSSVQPIPAVKIRLV